MDKLVCPCGLLTPPRRCLSPLFLRFALPGPQFSPRPAERWQTFISETSRGTLRPHRTPDQAAPGNCAHAPPARPRRNHAQEENGEDFSRGRGTRPGKSRPIPSKNDHAIPSHQPESTRRPPALPRPARRESVCDDCADEERLPINANHYQAPCGPQAASILPLVPPCLRASQFSLPNLPQPPCDCIHPPRKVQHRPPRQRNSQRSAHRVPLNRALRRLQRPWHMMDIRDMSAPVPHARKQAVPLRQPVLQGPGLRRVHRPDRSIRRRKLRPTGPALDALRRILNRLASPIASNLRPVIRQAIRKSRNPHRRRARRIETQKPHPRPISAPDVRPDVYLRKRRQPRQRRKHAMADARHSKWNDSHPRPAIVRIDLDLRRNQRPQRRRLHRPVRKEQIMPDHLHPPGQRRQGPGTMVDHLQKCGIHDARRAYANRHFRASETSIRRPTAFSQPPTGPLDARAIIQPVALRPRRRAAGAPGVLQ